MLNRYLYNNLYRLVHGEGSDAHGIRIALGEYRDFIGSPEYEGFPFIGSHAYDVAVVGENIVAVESQGKLYG